MLSAPTPMTASSVFGARSPHSASSSMLLAPERAAQARTSRIAVSEYHRPRRERAIPAVLVKLGPLDAGRVADLRPYLDSVPDPSCARPGPTTRLPFSLRGLSTTSASTSASTTQEPSPDCWRSCARPEPTTRSPP